MSKTNYEEQLFNSIDLIVEKRIANLDYDKTIICTITDNSDKHNNKYSVSDGSTIFIAQGDGNTYAINDKVKVLIPQGNFSKEKYIQGKHNSDDIAKPITYVSPLGSVLKISDNLLSHVPGTYAIVANGPNYEIPIGNFVEFNEDYLQNEDIFDTLYVQAQFQTYFEQPNMRDGDYGLHIKLITRTEDEETQEIKYDAYGLYFSAKKDMFGNPYAFKIFTEQEIKYTLSQWPSNIIGLQVFLYQDNNFKYYDDNKPNELQTYQPNEEVMTTLGSSPFNIKVSNIEIGFGSDITNANSAKLKLYTPDLETYHSDSDTIEDNRTLKLLWYNRSEDNKYIGFSDGKYDPDYDEDDYLAEAALNTRLLAAKTELYPDDEVCLSLAADAKDIKVHCQSLNKIIGTDLPYLLRGFKDYLFGISFDSDPFEELLGNGDNSFEQFSAKFNSQNEDSDTFILLDYYEKTLKWAKSNDGDQLTLVGDPEENILSVINYNNANDTPTIYYLMDNLFSTIKNIIDTHPSYQSVYNTYEARWNDIKNTLIKIYDKLNIIVSAKIGEDYQNSHENLQTYSNMELLEDIKHKKDSSPYVDKTKEENFKNNWDNRYCVYWYRKDDSITTYDPHLGKIGWERLTSYNNIGIPSEDEQNEGYCEAKTNDGLTITLRRKDEERFCAVMFHNHEKIISTELVFNNLDDIPDPITMDNVGALFIEHNNKQSQNSYQLYGPDGWLMNTGDAQTKRELRVRFDGETGKDEQLIGAFVYWYVPLISTMVEIYDTIDMKDNFIKIPEEGLDENGTEKENYKSGYVCYRHFIGQNPTTAEGETPTVCEADTIFPYHIKRLYQQTATQNTILCVVKKDNLTYYASQSFSFSSFGNSGTDYTLALIPNPESPYVKNEEGYVLYTQTNLYDHNGNQLIIPSPVSNPFSWVGPTGYEVSAQIGSSDNLIGCNISKLTGNNCYYGVLNCLIKDIDISFGESSVKAIDLQSSIPISYSFNDNFYIEGASSIVYDSNGGNPKYYNNPYVLYSKFTNEPINNIIWSLIHYYPTNNNNTAYDTFKVDYTTKKIYIYNTTNWTWGDGLDFSANIDNTTYQDKYSLNFIPKLDTNNIIIPSPMYITGQNIYTVAIAQLSEAEDGYEAGTVVWAQPILITQNIYSSSVINKWDGGLTVNEEDNMILSAMVGAGRKNERNKFEGVLMGDVGTKAKDNSISEIGLYGFHDGAQSFGFKVDGTAFLGKSSGGRIEFNGNTGVIYSNNWLQNITDNADGKYTPFDNNNKLKTSTDGMAIDLTNGAIDAHNFKLTSGNFILSNTHIIPDSNSNLANWYNTDKGDIIFKSGTVNNNFAITTAGYFYAEAGKIANWIIGENYLTTDAALGTTNSFHMYSNGDGSGEIIGNNPEGTHNLDNWMLTIGKQFGVDGEGKMYASAGWIGSFELSEGGLHSKFITIDPQSIVFPMQTYLSLSDIVSIGSDTERVYMQTTSKLPFVIQNLDGAGIKFFNVTVSDDTNTILKLSNFNVTTPGEYDIDSFTGIFNRSIIWMEFSCDYEWTSGAPFLDFGVSVTVQIVYQRQDNIFTDPYDATYERTFTFSVPGKTNKGNTGMMRHPEPLIDVNRQAAEIDYHTIKVKKSGTNTYHTDSFNYTSISSNNENKTLYSLGSFCPEQSSINDKNEYVEGCFLGNDYHVWDSVVAFNINQKSDKNLKNSIKNIEDKYSILFDALHPVSYRFNSGSSGRRHFGFIAQEIGQSLQALNISSVEFAPYCDYRLPNDQHTYSLRYTEFIPLNTWQIQKLKPRMTEAEERIYKLEQELAELKSKLI